MQHQVKKLTRIVDEILTMFMLNGAEEIDVKMKKEGKKIFIYFTMYNCPFDDDYLQELEDNLNIQRQAEVEGYYWQLTGENDLGEELFLVGAMIDQAFIEKRDGHLYLKLVRNIIY